MLLKILSYDYVLRQTHTRVCENRRTENNNGLSGVLRRFTAVAYRSSTVKPTHTHTHFFFLSHKYTISIKPCFVRSFDTLTLCMSTVVFFPINFPSLQNILIIGMCMTFSFPFNKYQILYT